MCVCVYVSLFLMHGHCFEQICMKFWHIASLYPSDGHGGVASTCRPYASANQLQIVGI